jgi:hypothetical protein
MRRPLMRIGTLGPTEYTLIVLAVALILVASMLGDLVAAWIDGRRM